MDHRRLAAALCALMIGMSGRYVFAQGETSGGAMSDPFLSVMKKAAAHAKEHHTKHVPAISPEYHTLLGAAPALDVKAMQDAGFRTVVWTVDDADNVRAMLALHVDGIISDNPRMLQEVVQEARTKAAGDAKELAYLQALDVEGHRGGRALRPENTLPAFEVGMDNGIHTIETDTGVTTDHQSLIWHDQYLNPQSCRKADGSPYTLDNRVYTHDISMAEAQKTFICDKLHFGPEQKNDLELSPVAVAFAKKEGMISPYAPTYVAQLFRFAQFYADWYKSGPGKNSPDATARAHTGATVHFNLETKIVPMGYSEAKMYSLAHGISVDDLRKSGKLPEVAFTDNRTVAPEVMVDVLCGTVMKHGMQDRADIQSFDFRTLQLVEEKYPQLQTFYLTGSANTLSTTFVPASLRATQ
jgi:glycerophosphoryl diester phosphodiesterase